MALNMHFVIKNYKIWFLVAMQHYFINILIKFENIAFFNDTTSIDFFAMFYLLICSWPDLTFSFCLGFVFKIFMDLTLKRYYAATSKICYLFVTLVNMYILINQVYYKVTFTHMKMSAVKSEQSINFRKAKIIFGSFLAELDIIFYVNVIVLIVTSYYVSLIVFKSPRPILIKDHTMEERNKEHNTKFMNRYYKYFTILYFMLTIFRLVDVCHLHRSSNSIGGIDNNVALDHPIVIFVKDYFSYSNKIYVQGFTTNNIRRHHDVNKMINSSSQNNNNNNNNNNNSNHYYSDLENVEITNNEKTFDKNKNTKEFMYQPIKGKIDEKEINDENVKINNYFEKKKNDKNSLLKNNNKKKKKMPNIIIYTLESVGSKNLLSPTDGYADKEITPNIASLQEHGITFQNVYDTFPSTTRAHIPLETGGITPTMGSIENQNEKIYTGETLSKFIKKQGYVTSLFAASDLRFEGLARFYEQFGYEKFHHYGNAGEKFQKESYLNSWGGNDHDMILKAFEYLDEQGEKVHNGNNSRTTYNDDDDDEKPIFIHFLPDASHHPYTTPSSFLQKYKKAPSSDRYENYKTVLHYTDECIGMLIDGLKKRKMWDNTVVILVGDHGEAFGRSHNNHPRNFLHKNFLYNENILTFFIFSHYSLSSELSKASEKIVSKRLASVGDFFPSTIGFLNRINSDNNNNNYTSSIYHYNMDDVNIPGQNLFSSEYKLQMQFFHKQSDPLQWGCRDGKMKIISNQLSNHVEMYDISNDPNEKVNLAMRLGTKDTIDKYEKRIQAWYINVHCWFTLQLKDCNVNNQCDDTSISNFLKADSMKHSGPKRGIIGVGHSAQTFRKIDFVEPDQKEFTIFIEWIAYTKKTNIIFDFAPIEFKQRSNKPLSETIIKRMTIDGVKAIYIVQSDRYYQKWQVEKGWHTSWYFFKKLRANKKVGLWNMILWDETDGFKTPKLIFNVHIKRK